LLFTIKRIAAWLLLFVFLSGTTEAYELLKLPMLFSHYAEHSNEQPALSFSDFLLDHYFGNSEHSHSHDQLPFQGNHHNHVVEAPIDQPLIQHFSFIFHVVHAHYNVTLQTFIPEGCHSSIWQPPKA
jgi:hypothetical protein